MIAGKKFESGLVENSIWRREQANKETKFLREEIIISPAPVRLNVGLFHQYAA